MAGQQRPRFVSESSSGSSDSYCIDVTEHEYAEVRRGSDEFLLPAKLPAKPKGRNKNNCHKRLAVISLVVSVVCLTLTLACVGTFVFFTYFSMPPSLPGVSENEEVCMPCDQISPNPLEDAESPQMGVLDVKANDDEGEIKLCCARTPAQYAALFKLILRRQEEVKKLADVLGSRTESKEDAKGSSPLSPSANAVSAHLLTKPVPSVLDDQGTAVQPWKSPSESPVSHVRQGLHFHDNKIYVQSPGLYYVYCQILYNRAHGDHAHYPTLASNYVKRHSVTYPASSGILLKARHTRASGENDRHSSYVGGLFFLHAGDQVFVQVSVPELVAHDDRGSFFGLFKVGN